MGTVCTQEQKRVPTSQRAQVLGGELDGELGSIGVNWGLIGG
jgi:hypothetical protein